MRERQSHTAVKNTPAHSWDQRRPRYLFSGLMVCGCCGSGLSKVGKNRFGCSAARNKGAAICTSRATIRCEDLEGRVLDALTEHLMDPELVRVLCGKYTAELSRLRAEAGAQRGARTAELERVKRDHAKLVDAILIGVPGEQVKDRMIALDARRQELEAELSSSPAPALVRLHPGMAEVYRKRVRELAESLADPTKILEVTEAIRALVDRIVLTPSAEDPRVPMVDLRGCSRSVCGSGSNPRTWAAAVAQATKKPPSEGRLICNQSWLWGQDLVTGCS